jgi:predicted oxidoreductase
MVHIVSSVDHVLEELRTEYLDVLLIHQPDPLMRVEDIAESITLLKDGGRVGYFGLSNFLPRHIDLFNGQFEQPLVTNQIEFSLAQLAPLHNGTLEKCQSLGMSPMAWSPLARGRIHKPNDERFYRIIAALNTLKKETGDKSKAAIALAWLLRHPSQVVPVLGSGNIKHLQQAAAATDIELSREQWFLLLTASLGRDVT